MPQPDAPPAMPPAPAVRALTCPNCGGAVELRAAGYTVTVACAYCGSILDVSDPQVKLVTRNNVAAAEIDIPLGTRGTLRGVEWEAIGYLQRSENGNYGWEEYLLFNPYHGYRWLVNVRGGWSLGEMLTITPDWRSFNTMRVGHDYYQRFFKDGHAQVDYVLGEFYWRVSAGEDVETADWVRPGWMLSREANANEVSWTLSELLPPAEMKAAFGVAPPWRIWPPLPQQRSPQSVWLGTGLKIGAATMAFLLLLALLFGGDRSLATQTLPVAADGRDQSATVGPITLTRPWQRVAIRADVPQLENGWVDLDYTLVDRKTQQTYDAYGAAERYSGSDSDGPWTEGSRGSGLSVASVPAGTYDLVIDYKGNKWSQNSFYDQGSGWMDSSNAPQVVVTVSTGSLYGSNLILIFFLVGAPLLIGVVGHARFEKARQGESDFAPTGIAALMQSSGDDD